MKKIIISFLCFVFLNKATAQADKVILDNVFQNINKATIPTGYLQDYGVAFVNKESYKGILTDSNAVANLSAFRLMYNDIISAKINPAAPKYSIPNAEFTVAQKLNQGTIVDNELFHWRLAFFGSFFSTKKRTYLTNISSQKNTTG